MRKPPATPDDLLSAVEAEPTRSASLLRAALMGDHGRSLTSQVAHDPRFIPALLRALADLEGLEAAPWLVQLAGRIQAPVVVGLLVAVWRSCRGSAPQQAGQELLRLSTPEALEALAADLVGRTGIEATLAIQAHFALDAAHAFDRLHEVVASDPHVTSTLLWHLTSTPALLET